MEGIKQMLADKKRYGWPKCCGYTMTIDSPEEQKRLAAMVPNVEVQGEALRADPLQRKVGGDGS